MGRGVGRRHPEKDERYTPRSLITDLHHGASVRLIKRERRWVALVTFADGSQGHVGTVYRATNWKYVGVTKPEERWVDPTGRQVSRKRGPKSRSRAEMLSLGFVSQGKFVKHKFVMFLDR